MDTIVALATPPGKAGIGVIRISGRNALNILKSLTGKEEFNPRYMYLTKIKTTNFNDNVLSVYFKAPHSFTGEDVAEIQMHSGYYIIQEVINKCIELGCKLATKGEFSKRAFLNGKLTLDKAEGIIDLINAESSEQAKASSMLAEGDLSKQISNIQSQLTDILAEIEAKIDYPEYDFDDTEMSKFYSNLSKIKDYLKSLINNSKNGIMIKNGVKIAIVGEPNVGKSSIMNALVGSDKSIVTEIAGTTRDIVEGEYIYKGIIFRLFDTAGIHESEDKVEKIGMERAKKSIKDADLVLKVSTIFQSCDIEVDGPFLEIVNKIDLKNNYDIKDKNKIFVSALKGENIEYLKQKIFEKTIHINDSSDKLLLTNDRHIYLINKAYEHICFAIENIKNSATFDIISSDLKNCWESLGEITGVVSNENIIDRIFQKFCLGK